MAVFILPPDPRLDPRTLFYFSFRPTAVTFKQTNTNVRLMKTNEPIKDEASEFLYLLNTDDLLIINLLKKRSNERLHKRLRFPSVPDCNF